MSNDGCKQGGAGGQRTASGIIVYLMEELGDARLRCAQLKKYVHDATELVEKSTHRDHFFEVAGNLIYGIPDVLLKLDKALDATALAAARLDYEEIKNGLRPEKAEELETALEETRLRYLNRRSNGQSPIDGMRLASTFKFRTHTGPTQVKEVTKRLQEAGIDAHDGTEHVYGTIEADDDFHATKKINQAAGFKLIKPQELHKSARKESAPMNAKTAAYFLNKIADLTDKGGRVPVRAVMTLVAKLEKGDKKAVVLGRQAGMAFRNLAKELVGKPNPSRVALAGVLRRIVGDTLQVGIQQQHAQMQQGQQAGAGEDFQKANPKITDEEAKVIDEMHDEHKDVVKDKAEQEQQQ